jgi:mRNA interferase HigB
MGAEYDCSVRVVARSTLTKFVENRVSRGQKRLVAQHLNAWFKVVSKSHWTTPADLKEQFGSASVLSSSRVVFNIKGNDYRLIASVNFRCQALYIKWLGTHAEYDEIDAGTVQHDEGRYGTLSDSK